MLILPKSAYKNKMPCKYFYLNESCEKVDKNIQYINQ